MIEINLLPEEIKKKKRRIELPEIPFVPITVGIVGVFIILQILLNGFIFLSRRQLAQLDKKWESLAPQKAKLDGLKRMVSRTGKKNQAIEDLMKKRVNWTELLSELNNSIPSNIWLTELAYNERAEGSSTLRTLKLLGSATGRGEETTAHIARFIKALKGDRDFFKYFTDVELVSIKKGSVAGQDIMNFTLACKFKTE